MRILIVQVLTAEFCAMFHQSAMETYEARLESFGVVYPLLKKKGSHSKGAKNMKWPHKSPTPAQVSTLVFLLRINLVNAEMKQLAEAGFFYHPTDGSSDNTTCFLCHSNLDGWETGDDAVVEHLKHSPECGWAVNVAIELEREDGCDILANPSAEYLLRARTMTFGSSWPHENKRGWTCKIRKVVSLISVETDIANNLPPDGHIGMVLLSNTRKRRLRQMRLLSSWYGRLGTQR